MNITPLQGEFEILEHRRARLEEMLGSDMISEELHGNLAENLRIVEARIAGMNCLTEHPSIQSRAA
jgi:hypothetical protein